MQSDVNYKITKVRMKSTDYYIITFSLNEKRPGTYQKAPRNKPAQAEQACDPSRRTMPKLIDEHGFMGEILVGKFYGADGGSKVLHIDERV